MTNPHVLGILHQWLSPVTENSHLTGVPVRGQLWAVLIEGPAGEPCGQSTHLGVEGGDHREQTIEWLYSFFV